MKEQEAKNEAYQVWAAWKDRKTRGALLALKFYTHLENHHSSCLNFPCRGDRYQVVKSWVERWQQLDRV